MKDALGIPIRLFALVAHMKDVVKSPNNTPEGYFFGPSVGSTKRM